MRVVIEDLMPIEHTNVNSAKQREVQMELNKLEIPKFSFEFYKKTSNERLSLSIEKSKFKKSKENSLEYDKFLRIILNQFQESNLPNWGGLLINNTRI